jgi:hypothetical protein
MLVYTKNTFKKTKSFSSSDSKKALFEYEQWLVKHGVSKKPISKDTVGIRKGVYKPPVVVRREVAWAPSKDSGIGNATKPIEGKRYTGTSMIGIATMHKSNLVPVFQEENCKELAKMRR